MAYTQCTNTQFVKIGILYKEMVIDLYNVAKK